MINLAVVELTSKLSVVLINAKCNMTISGEMDVWGTIVCFQ